MTSPFGLLPSTPFKCYSDSVDNEVYSKSDTELLAWHNRLDAYINKLILEPDRTKPDPDALIAKLSDRLNRIRKELEARGALNSKGIARRETRGPRRCLDLPCTDSSTTPPPSQTTTSLDPPILPKKKREFEPSTVYGCPREVQVHQKPIKRPTVGFIKPKEKVPTGPSLYCDDEFIVENLDAHIDDPTLHESATAVSYTRL